MEIDPALVATAVSYTAALLTNAAAGVAMDKLFTEAAKLLIALVGPTMGGKPDTGGDAKGGGAVRSDPRIQRAIEEVIGASPALRRAQMAARVVEGARILWVDDNPDNNRYERRMFVSLKAEVEPVTSTDVALSDLRSSKHDLVISDMARGGVANAGVQFLQRMRDEGNATPVVFYFLNVDRSRGVPPGAFGMTNRPDQPA